MTSLHSEESLFPYFASMQQEAQYVDSFALRFSLQYLRANDDIRSILRGVLYEHIARFCDRAMLFLAPLSSGCRSARDPNTQSELKSLSAICQRYSLILQALDADAKESLEFVDKKQILEYVVRTYQDICLDGTEEK